MRLYSTVPVSTFKMPSHISIIALLILRLSCASSELVSVMSHSPAVHMALCILKSPGQLLDSTEPSIPV